MLYCFAVIRLYWYTVILVYWYTVILLYCYTVIPTSSYTVILCYSDERSNLLHRKHFHSIRGMYHIVLIKLFLRKSVTSLKIIQMRSMLSRNYAIVQIDKKFNSHTICIPKIWTIFFVKLNRISRHHRYTYYEPITHYNLMIRYRIAHHKQRIAITQNRFAPRTDRECFTDVKGIDCKHEPHT